jgi:hypothetical protein
MIDRPCDLRGLRLDHGMDQEYDMEKDADICHEPESQLITRDASLIAETPHVDPAFCDGCDQGRFGPKLPGSARDARPQAGTTTRTGTEAAHVTRNLRRSSA